MAPKAIETSYGGYKYRSRVEARWAVFLDALDIRYEYEPQGFDLKNVGPYLPDFFLPDYEYWLEIKGKCPTADETDKAQQLAIETRQPVFVFYGPPRFDESLPALRHLCGETTEPPSAQVFAARDALYFPRERDEYERQGIGWDYGYDWVACKWCGRVGLSFAGTITRLPCDCWVETTQARVWCEQVAASGDWAVGSAALAAASTLNRMDGFGPGIHAQTHRADFMHPKLLTAYEAARSARFEHGEHPITGM